MEGNPINWGFPQTCGKSSLAEEIASDFNCIAILFHLLRIYNNNKRIYIYYRIITNLKKNFFLSQVLGDLFLKGFLRSYLYFTRLGFREYGEFPCVYSERTIISITRVLRAYVAHAGYLICDTRRVMVLFINVYV